MFESARIRLTVWYIAMLMIISILFSTVIYRIISNQIEGFIQMQNERIAHFQNVPSPPRNQTRPEPPYIDTSMLKEQEQQLLLVLVFANIGILFIAGGAGYVLSGRTLYPIKLMLDEQNLFISNASHELRTPISTMRAEMEGSLLEKSFSDKQVRLLVKSNLEELSRLQTLTNNLLELAHVHHGTFITTKEQVHINIVLKMAYLQVTVLAKQKNIKINVPSEDEVLNGDKERLIELFVILLENAIKYSPSDTAIHISIEKTKHICRIRVKDQGIGIQQKDIEHIFDRFYRADPSRSQTDGFGLGLSIAKTIANLHNGTIRVESDGKNGSTFIVELPLS